MRSWVVVALFLTHYVMRSLADNLALLSGTLRTYQKASCDDEMITLRCPSGTSIDIIVAQYGKSTPNICTQKATKSPPKTTFNYSVPCFWPSATQSGNWEDFAQESWGKYSLLQTVVEACQKKRTCKFQTAPKTFGGDPCPGVRKLVEVAYRCRPYEFRSKVACENDRLQLVCNPNQRIAIYSASYGRTKYESHHCPQPEGVPEETCLVSYATETVMQLCHGKRSCELAADKGTFGNPCTPGSRMNLNVVYTCVPRKVLKEQYETSSEPDELDGESENADEDDDFETYDAGKEFIRESAASPPNKGETKETKFANKNAIDVTADSNKGQDYASLEPYRTPRTISYPFRPSKTGVPRPNAIPDPECDKTRVIGFVSEWINAYTFVSQNQERFYLYLILSVAVGILLCLTLLVGRLLIQRHRARKEAKFHQTNIADNSLPNGFADDISEVDADIDLTTPLPVPSVAVHSPFPMGSIAEVVRYPHAHAHSHTLPLRTDAPRSLSTASNTQYYYG